MPMFLKKCPHCQSSQTWKNGFHKGSQLYKCKCCGRQFIGHQKPDTSTIWQAYLEAKQTIAEIAAIHQISESTVKRALRQKTTTWQQPNLVGRSGFVHLDATYWGHNWGVMLGLDDATGMVLYLAFIKHETIQSYIDAEEAIVSSGYEIRGIIIDGRQELFNTFQKYPIQMCQFHMIQIVKRYLTKNPKMNASRELLALCRGMVYQAKDDFEADYIAWKIRWKDFLNKRTVHKDGKSYYLHRRIRTLVSSLDFYLPYLFTYQRTDCVGMPNTNNKIEGTFTDLKKNLNNHSGLSTDHRKQFITAYFQSRQ